MVTYVLVFRKKKEVCLGRPICVGGGGVMGYCTVLLYMCTQSLAGEKAVLVGSLGKHLCEILYQLSCLSQPRSSSGWLWRPCTKTRMDQLWSYRLLATLLRKRISRITVVGNTWRPSKSRAWKSAILRRGERGSLGLLIWITR